MRRSSWKAGNSSFRESTRWSSARIPPLGLDRAGPWEDGFVVNRRISHRAQCKIEMLHPSDDSHEKAGDERRTLHRPDTNGGRFLPRLMFASTLRLCNATQTASPESTDVKTGLVS